MSGGSYNYLCYKDSSDLLGGGSDGDLQQMADKLASLGYADDAAKETEQLLLTLRQCRNRIESSRIRLSGVWRGIEWWQSGDSSEESLKRDLKEYRQEGKS